MSGIIETLSNQADRRITFVGGHCLEDIRALPGVEVIEVADEAYLVVREDEHHWIEFAFFVWVAESDDGIEVDCIFRGSGTGGILRELRHMRWGEEGYIYYLPMAKTIKAIEALGRFFED